VPDLAKQAYCAVEGHSRRGLCNFAATTRVREPTHGSRRARARRSTGQENAGRGLSPCPASSVGRNARVLNNGCGRARVPSARALGHFIFPSCCLGAPTYRQGTRNKSQVGRAILFLAGPLWSGPSGGTLRQGRGIARLGEYPWRRKPGQLESSKAIVPNNTGNTGAWHSRLRDRAGRPLPAIASTRPRRSG
jgi:hypothetical protein